MENLYKMQVVHGDGRKTDGGDFVLKMTPKTITFTCVRKPWFSNRMSKNPLRINLFYRNGKPAHRLLKQPVINEDYISYMNNGHVARFWQDSTITVYPDQSGVPHCLVKEERAKIKS